MHGEVGQSIQIKNTDDFQMIRETIKIVWIQFEIFLSPPLSLLLVAKFKKKNVTVNYFWGTESFNTKYCWNVAFQSFVWGKFLFSTGNLIENWSESNWKIGNVAEWSTLSLYKKYSPII